MEDAGSGVGLPYGLRATIAGEGVVTVDGGATRLTRPASPSGTYVNAQIGDLGPLARVPPLQVRLRARFGQSRASFHGTAGFGFWNAALGPGISWPRPPRAAWFFLGGEEFDVPLALGVSGNGFKAAILDAQRPVAYALLPAAPLGFLLMRNPFLYRRLWPLAQRALRVAERSLGDLDISEWHTYDLVWTKNRIQFRVDAVPVLDAPGPGWPLGFVAWIDNAYAVATPRGQFAVGTVRTAEAAALEIVDLEIKYGAGPGGPAP